MRALAGALTALALAGCATLDGPFLLSEADEDEAEAAALAAGDAFMKSKGIDDPIMPVGRKRTGPTWCRPTAKAEVFLCRRTYREGGRTIRDEVRYQRVSEGWVYAP